jgi:hypothetical protein
LGVNHWIIIPIIVIAGLLLFRWFEKKGFKETTEAILNGLQSPTRMERIHEST